MFTGIVEEMGTLTAITAEQPAHLTVACRDVLADARIGDSISVEGCCLSITDLQHDEDGNAVAFSSDLMGETLARTSLGERTTGDQVNLERALRADDRLGGHLVQGHVDGVCTVRAIEEHEEWQLVWFDLPASLSPYVVEKGSITLAGVSLTVADVTDDAFAVGLIPHTLKVTTLGRLAPGQAVNAEADVVAKYVERLLAGRPDSPYVPEEQ